MKDINNLVYYIKKYTKYLIKNNKHIDFLHKAKICDKNGNIYKKFR